MTQQTNLTNASDKEVLTASDEINTASANNTFAEKTFTQEQVEALIAERIKRERKVNEALIPVKQLLKQLQEKGTVSGKSYSEIAENLISRLTDSVGSGDESAKQSADTPDLQSERSAVSVADNEENGTVLTCDKQACDGEEPEQKSGDLKEKQESCVSDADMQALYDFKKKHPEADMNMLFDSDLFSSFAKGKSGSLMQLCEDYCLFISKLQAMNAPKLSETFSDMNTASDDGLVRGGFSPMNSTAFSSMSGTSASPADGLTKQQMEIAKNGGLSYREYAELLSSIPNKNSLR